MNRLLGGSGWVYQVRLYVKGVADLGITETNGADDIGVTFGAAKYIIDGSH